LWVTKSDLMKKSLLLKELGLATNVIIAETVWFAEGMIFAEAIQFFQGYEYYFCSRSLVCWGNLFSEKIWLVEEIIVANGILFGQESIFAKRFSFAERIIVIYEENKRRKYARQHHVGEYVAHPFVIKWLKYVMQRQIRYMLTIMIVKYILESMQSFTIQRRITNWMRNQRRGSEPVIRNHHQ
jgi:hypothetical protein